MTRPRFTGLLPRKIDGTPCALGESVNAEGRIGWPTPWPTGTTGIAMSAAPVLDRNGSRVRCGVRP